MPINVEEGWDVLQKAITKVKNILEGLPEPQFTSGESMLLYTTVYNICMCNPIHPLGPLARARPLYDKYKEAFEEYIISTVLPSLREKKDELLLREMLRRWSNHKIMTKWLSRFFHYLDKLPQWEHPSLKEIGYSSFYNLVYREMNKQVLDAMLTMVDQKRSGEKIDRTLVINALDFYLEFEEITRKNNAKEAISSRKINLISSDGDAFEVDFGLAVMSKTFEEIMETILVGDVDSIHVSSVSSKVLRKIIEYCKKHNNTQKNVGLRDWDVQFIDVDRQTLLELDTSAKYLKIDSLRNLTNGKVIILDLIEGARLEDVVKFFMSSGKLQEFEALDLLKGKKPEEIAQFIIRMESSLLFHL